VAETRAVILKSDSQRVRDEVELMINDLHGLFKSHWEGVTAGTPLVLYPIPAWEGPALQSFIQNIMGWIERIPH
jgi:hypothetical protein